MENWSGVVRYCLILQGRRTETVSMQYGTINSKASRRTENWSGVVMMS